ncbi:hypothetical protein D9757_000429 [Collybiopsis confluens]|uniref:Uncharacterized protein n=1 Tax=Collybiopsis confluens TaxID=2823264 RepID=A0A8H5I1X2_9AGAR|nr:hypothetical protein D9757_000429 [Collybiopsis confluens]
MTSTTSISSSSTSTSTSASASTVATSPSMPGGLFNVTGSQPLILVFLAVGLFSAISIAVLGWRRAYYVVGSRQGGRSSFLNSGGRDGRDETDTRVGDRPRMWDLWTKVPVPVSWRTMAEGHDEEDRGGGGSGSEKSLIWEECRREGSSTWGNIMPITVSPIIPEKNDDAHNVQKASNTDINRDSDEVFPASSPLSRGRRQLEALNTRLGLQHNRETRPPQQMNQAEPETQNVSGPALEERVEGKRPLTNPVDDNGWDLPEHESLDVVVAIAMPMPKKDDTPRSGLGIRGETVAETWTYEYAIGVCRVP